MTTPLAQSPLYQLQSAFAKSLRYEDNGDTCQIVVDHFSSSQRIQIYRNNFVIGLSELVALTYPMVVQLVGQACFDGLARQHVLNNPLSQADVSSYGEHFNKTIASVDAVHSAVPYLHDIARLEWALDSQIRSFEQGEFSGRPPTSGRQRFELDQLANLDESTQAKIVLCAPISLTLIQSPFALFSIRQAILNDDFTALDTHTPEQMAIWVTATGELSVERLTQDEYALLNQITAGHRLAEIDEHLLSSLPKLLSFNLFDQFEY